MREIIFVQKMKLRHTSKNILALILVIVFSIPLLIQPAKALVLGISEDMFVNAQVFGCILRIKVYPERRIPAVNNWQTDLQVEVYQGTTLEGEFTTTTDSLGNATINLCSQGLDLQNGNYDYYIKGKSHLRKLYSNISGYATFETDVDFTTRGFLLAGETSTIFDNVINMFDLSTQLLNYSTSDDKNDLNQDGEVNILDISNTLVNYELQGD